MCTTSKRTCALGESIGMLNQFPPGEFGFHYRFRISGSAGGVAISVGGHLKIRHPLRRLRLYGGVSLLSSEPGLAAE